MLNIQDEVNKILKKHGQSEMSSYKIQLLCKEYAEACIDEHENKKLKSEQSVIVRDCDKELNDFARFLHNHSYVYKGFRPETLVRMFNSKML